jgi:hypothetical protein
MWFVVHGKASATLSADDMQFEDRLLVLVDSMLEAGKHASAAGRNRRSGAPEQGISHCGKFACSGPLQTLKVGYEICIGNAGIPVFPTES